jgi:hypothetical protein
MSGLVAILKKKQRAAAPEAAHSNPYALASEFPAETDRIFDNEINLLLMDGWVQFLNSTAYASDCCNPLNVLSTGYGIPDD